MDDRNDDHEPPDLDEVLATFAADAAHPADTAAGEAGGLDRADLELLGLVAYEIEPVAPSPALKLRVMAAIREPAAAGAPEGAAVVPLPRRRVAAPHPSRPWFAALAAGVALVAVLSSGWMALRLAEEKTAITELNRRLSAAERRADDLALARGEVLERSRELAAQLAKVTAPGIEVCPLRPTRDRAGGWVPVASRALLFMAAADGVWYLRVHDLPPPPEGAVYVLWFLGDDGATLSAGVVPAVAGGGVGTGAESAVLSRGALPGMRAMSRGVALTVERNPQAVAPTGPMVLFGDEKMGLL